MINSINPFSMDTCPIYRQREPEIKKLIKALEAYLEADEWGRDNNDQLYWNAYTALQNVKNYESILEYI